MPFMARRPWLVIALWLVVIAACLPLARQVAHHLGAGGFTAPHSAAAAANATTAHLRTPAVTAPTLLTHAPAASLRALAVQSGLPTAWLHRMGPDQSVLVPGPGQASAAARFVRLATRAGARAVAVDDASIAHAVSGQAVRAFKESTSVAVPALLVLLPLVFGAVFPALLPLVTAGVGTLLCLALVSVVERYVPLSVYLLEIVTFLALGVGVDYALFVSTRFRTRVEAGAPVPQALAEAMRTSGRSVLFSGIAVALAMSALVIGGTTYWWGLALGGGLAVASVLCVTHTLLPALLALMGRRVSAGRVAFALPHWPLWRHLAGWATARPHLALALGLAALVLPALASPAVRAQVPANVAAMLPAGSPLARASAIVQAARGAGSIAPLIVSLRLARPLGEAAAWRTVGAATARLERLPDVAAVGSPTLLGMGSAALAEATGASAVRLRAFVVSPHVVDLFVTARTGPDQAATVALVGRIDAALSTLPGVRAQVGGAVATMRAFDRYLGSRLPWMAVATALVAFLVLFAATRSWLQAALGVGLNALVALSTAGILVLTVQRGAFGLVAEPLNMAVAPLVFVILFGLSMDYQVILLNRIQERLERGDEAGAAARHAVGTSGGMITGAGLIMVAVVAALLVSPFEILQTLAIGLISAVLLDTLVVRTFVVPAMVTLLGAWAFGRPRLLGPAA